MFLNSNKNSLIWIVVVLSVNFFIVITLICVGSNFYMLIDLVEKDVVYKACLGFGVYETTKLQYFICISNIFFMFFIKF